MPHPKVHYVYLLPGMFGFAKLAGYDYFGHIRLALEYRFAQAGQRVVVIVVSVPPTSSIRHRARLVTRAIRANTNEPDAIIHLLGHSTGGLDARLLLSPTVNIKVTPGELAWRKQVRSIVTLNTPHYGTPLATYFATVAGTRVLYALSLLTILSLTLGASSLAVFARLFAGIGSLEGMIGRDFRLVGKLSDVLLRYIDSEDRRVIEAYLNKMRVDQGAIIQITPEAMDLFNAATTNDPAVRYGCVVSAAPPPKPIDLGLRVRSPYAAFSAAMFSTLYAITSQRHVHYGYARPRTDVFAKIRAAIPTPVHDESNDAIVPTLSMLWGEPVWCGPGDHLDLIGHFRGGPSSTHVDWLTSGANFDRFHFSQLMDAIVSFQLAST